MTNCWKHKLSFTPLSELVQNVWVDNTFGLCFAEHKKQKTLHLIPLNESLTLTEIQDSDGCLLRFDRELIEEADVEYALDVMNLFNLTKDRKLHLNTEVWQDTQTALAIIKNEWQKSDGSFFIIQSALKILLLYLIRYQNHTFIDQDLQQKRIYSFLQLMEQNYQNQIEVHFYAERLGISSRRLNQIVKEKLGLSAHQIIQQRRLTEIKRELQNKNQTLKEIAYQYHFNSAVSFNRFFKRYTHISPLEFRNQH